MKVPLLDLAAQYRAVESEIREAIHRVLESQAYVLGPEVAALEQEVAALCGVQHGIATSSGTDAILASLMALGVGPGDEAIVPTFTFFATAGCVTRVGATPVFVDVLSDTFNIDPAAIEAAVTPRTKAIIPVHLYGQCVDMDRIAAIARCHGLEVIEDAAQAIGASFNGRPVGSLSKACALSFYPTKNLSAMGDAGMIVTPDAELAGKLRFTRDHGQNPRYYYHFIGGNFRMDGFQGAVLRVKLRRLAEWTAARQVRAARYDKELKGSAVVVPPVDPRCEHVYHQYTVRCERRDELQKHLADAGIGAAIYYPLPLHLQPCFADLGYKQGAFPVAEQAAKEVLSLPISPEMSEQQQEYVIQTIRKF
ncbi:MAG TPA: DegT/DnrJ/EryC1/StrS family aminotransferase [Phycisphaerae bacterium]|nr:DegT/DnrJ/EryC1/StrS family aminotransferase [Phycisphaerae bacterium]